MVVVLRLQTTRGFRVFGGQKDQGEGSAGFRWGVVPAILRQTQETEKPEETEPRTEKTTQGYEGCFETSKNPSWVNIKQDSPVHLSVSRRKKR